MKNSVLIYLDENIREVNMMPNTEYFYEALPEHPIQWFEDPTNDLVMRPVMKTRTFRFEGVHPWTGVRVYVEQPIALTPAPDAASAS